MASITSLMGGGASTGGIYGSRSTNMITGLASGLDTEAMIEGMVQGHKQKIQNLQRDRTRLQWQQSAYQSISDKLVEFSRKYTSYTSDTNLASPGFFENAMTTNASGTHGTLVTASGKSSSQIVLNGVEQLATTARFTTGGTAALLAAAGLSVSGGKSTATADAIDLSQPQTVSAMSGSLTIGYGGRELTLDFTEDELLAQDGSQTLDPDKLQSLLNDKLKAARLTTASGDQVPADQRIAATVSPDGTVTLSDKSDAGNQVFFSKATGELKDRLTSTGDKPASFQVDTQNVTRNSSAAETLSGQKLHLSLNGQSKTVELGQLTIPPGADRQQANEAVRAALETAISDAFGVGKVTVSLSGDAFSFTAAQGDSFSLRTEDTAAGKLLGLRDGRITTYLDTSRTLEQLLGPALTDDLALRSDPSTVVDKGEGRFEDAQGNRVDRDGFRLDKDGNRLYALTVNGKEAGVFTKDASLDKVLNTLNGSGCGVKVSFSKLTGEFVFTAADSGSGGKIDMGDGLGKALFGDSSGYEAGQDARFTATVNGHTAVYTRASNTVELDGMTVTLGGVFEAVTENGSVKGSEGVTFTSKTDADAVVEAVRQMVNDYNALVTEVKKAYSDQPLQQTNGSRYQPLSAEDEAELTESEIKAYEEKAKTGLLFMDRDLNSLYNALRSAVTPTGADSAALREIGLKTSYENGLTTISLDEKALREALEKDPEQVQQVFSRSRENGADSDGLMASIHAVTERYAATTGATKGILIEKAGSKYAPTAALNNTLLHRMQELDRQIASWQGKMATQVDYYTHKFTKLETIINQMNAQSSALAGFAGGY